MAKLGQCPKCGGEIRFAATPPSTCPHCSATLRSKKRPVQPAPPPLPPGVVPQSDASQRVRDLLSEAPLRPSVAEYSVLAASLLLTVTAVLFATLGGRAPREVVALGEALEDAAAFPELARALPLSDVQVAEQVQNVQTRKTVPELVESLQAIAGGTSNLEPRSDERVAAGRPGKRKAASG